MSHENRWKTRVKVVTALFLLFLIGGYLYFVVQWPWGGVNGNGGGPEISATPDSATGDSASAAATLDYPITPVPFTEVTLADGFWLERIETNRETTIPFALQQNEDTERVDNFRKAAGLMEGKYVGERYNDTDVYKVLEGAAYSLQVHPDPALDAQLDELIAVIAAAQEDDGYLFTPRSVDPADPQPGIGDTRWSNLAVSHELYNAGHLYEAAVAHYQATGKRTLLDVAIKNADLVAATFGPDKQRAAPGHEVIEMGLVKLYRVTGDEKYLQMARYFLDQRGRDLELTQYPEGNRFAIYNDPVQIQAQAPVLEQTEAVGHAVRAMYLYSGMADVAAIQGDADYLAAVDTLWRDVVGTKLYLHGGVGGRAGREAFGEAYDLPNAEAYAETCASIGLVFWSWRLFLLHGDAEYLDVLERVLYNGLLAGVSLEGNTFFYPNPLASDGERRFNKGSATRQPWFGVACCPGNMTRFLPAVPGYVYATRGDDVYIANFIASEATLDTGGGPVTVTQQTDYPWSGNVRIRVEPLRPTRFALRLRIPGWARNRPVPSDLYRYDDGIEPAVGLSVNGEPVELSVNGEAVELQLEAGFAVLDRTWNPGDTVDLVLPMPVREVVSHPAVEADVDAVAIERGPLLYAVEGVDNGGEALDLALSGKPDFDAEWDASLLGGVMRITANAYSSDEPGAPVRRIVAIPYFAWSNRGANEMTVWLRRGR